MATGVAMMTAAILGRKKVGVGVNVGVGGLNVGVSLGNGNGVMVGISVGRGVGTSEKTTGVGVGKNEPFAAMGSEMIFKLPPSPAPVAGVTTETGGAPPLLTPGTIT